MNSLYEHKIRNRLAVMMMGTKSPVQLETTAQEVVDLATAYQCMMTQMESNLLEGLGQLLHMDLSSTDIGQKLRFAALLAHLRPQYELWINQAKREMDDALRADKPT